MVPGSGGVYSALLQFDVAGDVVGLVAQPTFLVSVGTWGSEEANCTNRVSFSPDMTKLVSDRYSTTAAAPTNQLVTVTVPGGVVTNLVTDASGRQLSAPKWSPSGAKIAFKAARVASDLRDYIDTILPTGTGRMSLTSSSSSVVVQAPVWCPDSNFVAYQKINTTTNEWDIYRHRGRQSDP